MPETAEGGMTMASGLRYESGRKMPPGMQELYGVKLAGEMQIATPAEPARNDNDPEIEEYPGYRYCGASPEREDLPECPFCGSENLLVDRDSEGWYVECNGCLAEGPRAPTQAEAERQWCRRR